MTDQLQHLDAPAVTPVMEDAMIARHTAALLTLCLVALMAVPFTQELLADPSPSLLSRSRRDLEKYGVQITLQEVEKHLVYDSQFASMVRQPYQRFLVRRLGEGSSSDRPRQRPIP
jgi:hypothetical protein